MTVLSELGECPIGGDSARRDLDTESLVKGAVMARISGAYIPGDGLIY